MIIWLASYPKSGNTWVRFFLKSYFNDAKLPEMTIGEELIEDYKSLKLSLKAHPVSLIRHIITPEAA